MITSVYKTIVCKHPDENDIWWTYMICRCRAGHRNRFHVIRIDDCTEFMERVGYEVTLGNAKKIIKELIAKANYSIIR